MPFKKALLILFLLIALPIQAAEVATWVPPYSVEQSYAMLNQDFGGIGMKDGLTRLGLQWWRPTMSGGIELTPQYKVDDAAIRKFVDWAKPYNIKILLCIYNPPPAAGKPWDWPRAQAAIHNPKVFVDAVLAEIARLDALGIKVDGVDMDLESSVSQPESDKKAYLAMMKNLSDALKEKGKILTAATYASKWNAPNIEYWPELVSFIDGITPMAYERMGYQVACEKMWNHPQHWCTYQFMLDASKLMDKRQLTLGVPSNVNYRDSASLWLGKTNLEHLRGIQELGAGVALWDSVLHPSWQTAEVWTLIKEIKVNREVKKNKDFIKSKKSKED